MTVPSAQRSVISRNMAHLRQSRPDSGLRRQARPDSGL